MSQRQVNNVATSSTRFSVEQPRATIEANITTECAVGRVPEESSGCSRSRFVVEEKKAHTERVAGLEYVV